MLQRPRKTPSAKPPPSFARKATAARITRFKRRTQAAAERIVSQLGRHQRECVYQRALQLELASHGYIAGTEHPVPVVYTGSKSGAGALVLATERADILVREKGLVYVLEIKKSDTATPDAISQVQRYGHNLVASGETPVCLGVVAFPRKRDVCPTAKWPTPAPPDPTKAAPPTCLS